MAVKKSESVPAVNSSAAYMAIPKPWLIALAVIFIVPWIAVAAIWLKPDAKTDSDAESSIDMKNSRSGKWGDLSLTPIIISPPMELVFTDWGFQRRPVWAFPNADKAMVAQILQSAGIAADDIGRLCAEARSEPRISGVVLTPDPEWVRGLNPESRAHLYRILARSGLNADQTQAFRFPGSSSDEWFGNMVSPHTRQIIEPLLYRDGSCMLFSDIELVRNEIGSEEELRRLGKALFRQPTVIARLFISPGADIDKLVEYWGRGGRRTEIRPLIESVADGEYGRFIDLVHLLPAFARDRLYSYPQLSAADLDKPLVLNCLWTALNFFSTTPDNRFLDGNTALKTLKDDYFIVEADYELGDIIAFLDEKGDLFHVAVNIADDLVFSKNGISAMAPWTLMSLEDVKSFYRWRSENPRLMVHRRKNL